MDIACLDEGYEAFISLEILTKEQVSFMHTPFEYECTIRLGDEFVCRSPDAPFDGYEWKFLAPPLITPDQDDEGVGTICAGTSRWSTVLPISVQGNPERSFLVEGERYLYPAPGDIFRSPHRKYWNFAKGAPVFVTYLSTVLDRYGPDDIGHTASQAVIEAMTEVATSIAQAHNGIIHDDFSWHNKYVSAGQLAKRQCMRMYDSLDDMYIHDMRMKDLRKVIPRQEILKRLTVHQGGGEGREKATRTFHVYE